MSALMKHPSAFIPVAMSLVALAIVLGHVAMFGAAREADEGAAAHLWQLYEIRLITIGRRQKERPLPTFPKDQLAPFTRIPYYSPLRFWRC